MPQKPNRAEARDLTCLLCLLSTVRGYGESASVAAAIRSDLVDPHACAHAATGCWKSTREAGPCTNSCTLSIDAHGGDHVSGNLLTRPEIFTVHALWLRLRARVYLAHQSEPPQTFQSIYTRIHTFQSPDHASDAQHGTAVLVDGARAVFTGPESCPAEGMVISVHRCRRGGGRVIPERGT